MILKNYLERKKESRSRSEPFRDGRETTNRDFPLSGETQSSRETSRPKIPASGTVRESPKASGSLEGYDRVRIESPEMKVEKTGQGS